MSTPGKLIPENLGEHLTFQPVQNRVENISQRRAVDKRHHQVKHHTQHAADGGMFIDQIKKGDGCGDYQKRIDSDGRIFLIEIKFHADILLFFFGQDDPNFSFFFLFKGDAGVSLSFFMEKVSAMWDATF